MHILLTGASGFIGHHFLKTFLEAGHRVSAPVRPESISKLSFLQSDKLQILKGVFYDPSLYDEIPVPDIIIHLASIRGAGNGKDADYRKVNTNGTRALLDYASKRNVKRFIYCSSVGVLGTIPQHVPAKPTDRPKPDGIYHQTKYESEKLVSAATELQTIVLRPTITYGAGDNGFVPRMIAMTLKKQLLLPLKQVKIHLLSVQAFADFVLRVIGQKDWPQKIYHVADKNPVVLKEIVDTISLTVTGKHYPKILHFPAMGYRSAAVVLGRVGMDGLKTSIELISKSWTYNISATQNDLGYNAVETLDKIKGMLKND